MAYGGVIPGYHSGGSIREHTHGRGPGQHLAGEDPEAVAQMERIVEAIKTGHHQFANQSPFGENPEENEFYRENILPEEKRTFG